jgi:hypothetical protein
MVRRFLLLLLLEVPLWAQSNLIAEIQDTTKKDRKLAWIQNDDQSCTLGRHTISRNDCLQKREILTGAIKQKRSHGKIKIILAPRTKPDFETKLQSISLDLKPVTQCRHHQGKLLCKDLPLKPIELLATEWLE